MFIKWCVTATFAFLTLSIHPSFAAGDAYAGKQIALQKCTACHVVTEDQPLASADVPTFVSIAKKYDEDIDYLVGFLMDPHPPMPNLDLTRSEIRNLLAFISSLKQ